MKTTGEVPPRLRVRHEKALAGRCHKPSVRVALAYALDGESLRAAAARVGVHASTVHEALQRYGLVEDWKRARLRRLRREHGGKLPGVWARHFRDVA